MRKILSFLFAMLMVCSFTACDKKNNSSDSAEKSEALLAEEQELREYSQYNRETYLRPYWNTREMYNETVLFVGENDSAPLLYEPSEIISVRNYGLDIEYKENEDYVLENGKIKRTSNSKIPYMEINEYYKKIPDGTELILDKSAVEEQMLPFISGPRYLKYGETTTFTKYQIAVTYRHNQPWKYDMVKGQAQNFSSFINKLEAGENAKILFFGDSITVGCNASGSDKGGNVSPYCETWTTMVTEYLNSKYNVNLDYVNTAIGGTNSRQGLERFDDDVIAHNPDLLVIAYGMNDRETTEQNYRYYIEQMVERYHTANPNGCVLLVSPMLPNPECSNWNRNQTKWEGILSDIATNNEFCALAPVTYLNKCLQESGKRYRDYTANNVNHPNDFIVRLYAQTVLKTLLGDAFFVDTYADVE